VKRFGLDSAAWSGLGGGKRCSRRDAQGRKSARAPAIISSERLAVAGKVT